MTSAGKSTPRHRQIADAIRELEPGTVGVTVEGIRYGPIQAELDRQQGANAWITVAITEGKNREVRRVLEGVGLKVNRLIRIAYGPFQLGLLEPGKVEEIPRKVVREQLGKKGPAKAPRAGARKDQRPA
jgi:23S rRNA pseudouridine2605 synthase